MDPKQCPHCERWCLKDDACNYIFACGLETKGFVKGGGCGKSWCWQCGKKFCGQYYDPITGQQLPDAKESHDKCCEKEMGFSRDTYCCGGHNSHCERRW